MKPIEPFGFFKPEPFGWTDCAETDDDAIPLYDKAAIRLIQKQRDELLAAIGSIPESSRVCLYASGYTGLVDWIDRLKSAARVEVGAA